MTEPWVLKPECPINSPATKTDWQFVRKQETTHILLGKGFQEQPLCLSGGRLKVPPLLSLGRSKDEVLAVERPRKMGVQGGLEPYSWPHKWAKCVHRRSWKSELGVQRPRVGGNLAQVSLLASGGCWQCPNVLVCRHIPPLSPSFTAWHLYVFFIKTSVIEHRAHPNPRMTSFYLIPLTKAPMWSQSYPGGHECWGDTIQLSTLSPPFSYVK